jgi:hypothetical protein
MLVKKHHSYVNFCTIDMKTTVTALIVESMRLYLKEIKKK